MAIIDTTNIIDSSIHLKAQLKHNMVGDNYYLEDLQEKRNSDWEYRYNVIDIEEELNKQCDYSKELPCYTPIDAVIQSVKDDKHNDLGTDWASLSFRELYHPNEIGYRYRFDYGHEGEGMLDIFNMSEEEKYYNLSVWIGINKTPVNAGNSLVVRRCNSSIALVGSDNRQYNNIEEIRYEPVIVDADSKLLSFYLNQTINFPSAIWTVTAQLNYFTNQIRLNDRVILGGVNVDDRGNNEVYRVNGIIKVKNTKTFSRPGSADIESIPLIIMGLEKDVVSPDDDFMNRVANRAPIYKIKEHDPSDLVPDTDYIVQLHGGNDINNLKVLLGETITRKVELANSIGTYNTNFEFEVSLGDIPEDEYDKYFEFEVLADENKFINTFSIKNKKTCSEGFLNVKCTAVFKDENGQIKNYTQDFDFELGGFY